MPLSAEIIQGVSQVQFSAGSEDTTKGLRRESLCWVLKDFSRLMCKEMFSKLAEISTMVMEKRSSRIATKTALTLARLPEQFGRWIRQHILRHRLPFSPRRGAERGNRRVGCLSCGQTARTY